MAGKTKGVILDGIAKWPMVRTVDEKYGTYKINLYMDKDTIAKFKAAGLRLELKTDEEGTFATFRRKDVEDQIEGEGGPPDVYLKDAQSGEFNLWKTGNIGNGSKVAIAVDYFPTKNGIGHRLQRVFVDTLVPYEGGGSKEAAPETAKLPF